MKMNLFRAFRAIRHWDELEAKNKEIEEDIHNKQQMVEKLEKQASGLSREITEAKDVLHTVEGTILSEELCCYTFPDKKVTSERLNKYFEAINQQITSLLASNNVVIPSKKFTVEGSEKKGSEFQKFYGENLLLGFNSYYDKKAKSVTTDNFTKTCELITANYDKMNKRASIIGAKLNPSYLNLKTQALKTLLDIKIVSAEERTKLNEEKRHLREQEKLLEEIERTKRELEKERKQYQQALGRSLTLEEKAKIEEKLAEITQKEKDVDYRLQNAKSGWLYVISSESLPNMVKIGATRRLNPLIRVKELSSASLPFPFVCHGLVFTEDVFDLEAKVHEYFNTERVNKDNHHKEFFNVDYLEALGVLKDKFNCEVQFAQADEFDNIESENDEND